MPSKSSTSQSVVIAQCYYDFRHQVDAIGKGAERKSLPLPAVLRIPTTVSTTTTYKGAAAVATLTRLGLHQDIHNRLSSNALLGHDKDKFTAQQMDGEERVIRHTKNSVTVRKQEPVAVTGDYILTHALGSLFYSSWRLYRSSVYEIHTSESGEDALGSEMAARTETLDRLEPSNQPVPQSPSLIHSANPFTPFDLNTMNPKAAAEHIGAIISRFEAAHAARQRRMVHDARLSSNGGPAIHADETNPTERDSLQTLLQLIDHIDVGAMSESVSSTQDPPAVAEEEGSASNRPPCPLHPFSHLLDPAFYKNYEDGQKAATIQPVMPQFLLDVLLTSESASPFAEVRILSEVVRRFDERGLASHALSSSNSNYGVGTADSEADPVRRDQFAKVHERHQRLENELDESTPSPKSKAALLVSLLSEPAQWYQLFDNAVEAFILQHQYAQHVSDREEVDSNHQHAGIARAITRSQHFSDPTSTYYYSMRAKKVILRSLCLSFLTYFDKRVGDLGASLHDKRPLLPSRYKEDYTVFISKPDGTLLPTWEEFCEDCGVPPLNTDDATDEEERGASGDVADQPIQHAKQKTAIATDPLQRAFEEAVYRFEALNDSRLVCDYLCPKLQCRIVTLSSQLADHPLAQKTHQYKQLAAMHPQKQLPNQQPTHTATDYIPLTFTVAFTPRHPATTGLHVAAHSVKQLAQAPTALFINRSPLLWVPDRLMVLGSSAKIKQIHSIGSAKAQSLVKEVADVFADLSTGVARLLVKALAVSTVNDLSSVKANSTLRTVVNSYIALNAASLITVSRNTKSGIEDDARQQEYAEDPSAATNIAVALQLLTHEDGHQSASLKCTAGLVEDRLASHRGVSRLDFLPTLQLPFPFLVSMRLAEYAEADKYLFLSASNERSGKAATGPYAVQWDEGAEDDALTHAAASLYEGSPATTSPQIKDSRDLLSYFTNPRAAERIVSDIVTLPTILVPERAGKARDMADAFVTRSVEGSKPSAARMGGEDEHILYGYHTLVQQQLQEKSTDVMVHSNLQGRPSVVKYEGRSEDLAALAGTVSLAALWEEAGMSAYELAMYGTGKVGTIALNYSAGSQSAVGRVVEATTPIASESNTHVDPLNSYLAPISVLAKHAARTCQRLAPSYIAQELERQRLDNVLAMAADRAVEDERTFKSHTAKIRDAVQIRAGPRSSANATNLADALLNDDIPAIANRMAHGKAQFDHLVRVGRKRLEEDEVAQTFASQNNLPAVRVAGPVEQQSQGMLVVRNRLNLSAPLIGHAHKAPTVEERRAKQEQQLARRLEARDLSRAMNLTQSGGAALEALIEPNNRMSLFVLKTLRPELRKLNAEERQLLEEKTLVTRLGEACATEKDEQTSHLDRSRESRNKTRDVTAEAADTMATEKFLMDRKGKVRQTERLREGALTGSLQRLLVDHEVKNHPSQAPPVVMVSASTSPLPISQDDRLLGFEHLMSRDRAAAYNT